MVCFRNYATFVGLLHAWQKEFFYKARYWVLSKVKNVRRLNICQVWRKLYFALVQQILWSYNQNYLFNSCWCFCNNFKSDRACQHIQSVVIPFKQCVVVIMNVLLVTDGSSYRVLYLEGSETVLFFADSVFLKQICAY